MKELTTEEKARRYDKAIEIAKEINNEQRAQPFNVMIRVFPELKESEDEQIRKAIIRHFQTGTEYTSFSGLSKIKILSYLEKLGQVKEFLISQHENKMCKENDDSLTSEDERIRKAIGYAIGQSTHSDGTLINGVSSEEALVWLEKQGEQMPDPRYKYLKELLTADDIYQMSMNDAMVEEAKNKAIEALSKLEISNLLEIEKHGEKKPADKVEPKFHKGDWVVYCHEDVDLITGIEEDGYTINEGGFIPFSCEDSMQLWDISLARDGDVLSYENEIFIVKKSVNINILYYCCYDREHFIIDSFYSLTIDDIDNIRPATKEQRDTLERAITNAGYRWDKENLKLKKI